MKVLVLAALILLLISLCAVLNLLRVRGIMSKLRWMILALLSISAACILGMLLVVIHAFYAFSGEAIVARIAIKPLGSQEFELAYTPAPLEKANTEHVRLRGDQWAISGGIVKWHPYLTALGLKSYHKPLRLSGQFSSIIKQRANSPTVYLLESGKDSLWEFMYRIGPYLPFIEAVYGSSAYAYVEPNLVQEIYVTPSGYLIKRKPLHKVLPSTGSAKP